MLEFPNKAMDRGLGLSVNEQGIHLAGTTLARVFVSMLPDLGSDTALTGVFKAIGSA